VDRPALSLAAGRYSNTSYDQLLLAWGAVGSFPFVTSFDFSPDTLQPELKATLPEIQLHTTGVTIRSGKFNWASPFDQAVLKVTQSPYEDLSGCMHILTLNTDLSFDIGKYYCGLAVSCSSGLAVGNFDHMMDNVRDPALQLAYVNKPGFPQTPGLPDEAPNQSKYCGPSYAHIYNVGPPEDFNISTASRWTLPGDSIKGITNYYDDTSYSVMAFDAAAGDTQGRSFVMGAPTKVTMNSYDQLNAILSAPPMHVDYISPGKASDGSDLPPTLINMSFAPKTYYSTYDIQEMTDTDITSKITSGFSFGAEQTIGAKLSFGDPDVEGLAVSVKAGLQETYDRAFSDLNNNYSSLTTDSSVLTTGGDDEVWWSDSSFTIYLYPVIGQKVCPSDQPDCSEDEKVPLVAQFSGSSYGNLNQKAGSSIEWYQPPWEPGNVFSYPANDAQLKKLFLDYHSTSLQPSTKLSILNKSNVWNTDNDEITDTVTWDTGSTTGSTNQTNTSFSQRLSGSISGKVGFGGGSISGSVETDVSHSASWEGLEAVTSKLGTSTTISVKMPGFPTGDYAYPVQTYITGETKPQAYINASTGMATTFGVLRAMFTASPSPSSNSNSGSFWQQSNYRSYPDVALNHPARWTVSAEQITTAPRPSNCLPHNENEYQCANLSTRDATDPWVSDFHYLRGFFITAVSADDTDGSAAKTAANKDQGIQLERATAGDKLLLSVRVYNDSFAEMGSNVNVGLDHRIGHPRPPNIMAKSLETLGGQTVRYDMPGEHFSGVADAMIRASMSTWPSTHSH
jgi:hypothetical protein